MRTLTILLLTLAISLTTFTLHAQNGAIKGRIFNHVNNEPLPFANIVIQGTTTGTSSDEVGLFEITGLEPALYNLEIVVLGFKREVVYEIQVFDDKPSFVEVGLEKKSTEIETVEIEGIVGGRTTESPVSMETLGLSEILRTPGGNRDVSKTIQLLPGVASIDGFRNDLIIRGGSSSENTFYIDGIEIRGINHLSTPGSTSGVWSLINSNFIESVDFYSSAFPASRGGALSGVMDFKFKNGNSEKLETAIIAGSSDLGVTFDGPLHEDGTIIFSVKQAYLGVMFKAFNFPIVPNFTDAQFKYNYKMNDKNEISLLGMGSIDEMLINVEANDGLDDQEIIDRNNVILKFVPEFRQKNYTIGANYKHFSEKGYQTVVLSRNYIQSLADKYTGNDIGNSSKLRYDFDSEELENKLRFENKFYNKGFKIGFGAGFENDNYRNSTYWILPSPSGTIDTISYKTDLTLSQYSLFGSASKAVFKERLVISLALRMEGSDYSSAMENPLDQLSPRAAIAYYLKPNLSINLSTGRYFQLPQYTMLGFKNNEGSLVNKSNLTYTRSDHYVAGIEYLSSKNLKISVEGFYKIYDKYPLLLTDSISFANVGVIAFGAVGDEPTASINKGRAYGLEVFLHQKLRKGFFGLFSYTYVKSEFQDKNEIYRSSAWDYEHLLNITAGKKFKKNWEIGMKFRLAGGSPYTPYDLETSAIKEVWNTEGVGLLDFDQLNSERTAVAHSLNVRVDKRYFYEKWSLNFYLDFQNVYNNQIGLPPFLFPEEDANGMPLDDPNTPGSYKMKSVSSVSPPFFPSIGIIAEF